MKILSVHFKNLNSLAGEWTIDFTHPSYADSGIFAITGPTGAGKSTILDAICIALYGETPRLGALTQSNNDVMTRGTSECSAEVQFATNRGKFRVTWQQRRARKKSDGQLQPPKHELANADTGAILASKLSEVRRLVDEITGMDFNRFTRSMLLAQGRFAVFLQSEPKDRAPILEQITGTEQYSTISIAVYERCKTVNEELKRLKTELEGIESLAPDMLAQHQAELVDKQQTSDRVKTELQQLDTQIQWLTKIDQLSQQIRQEERNQADLAAEILAFEPNKQRLQRDTLARQLDIPYSELCGLRRAHESAIKETNLLREKLPQLEQAKQDQQEQYNRLAAQLAILRKELEELLPILQQVRALDGDLGQRREQAARLRADFEKEHLRWLGITAKVTGIQTNLSEAILEQKQLDHYFATHAQDASLVEQFSGIEADICTWLSQSRDLNQRRDDRDADQGRLESAQSAVVRATTELQVQQSLLAKAESAWEQGNRALESLLQGRLLREYESDRDHLLEQKRLRSIIKSLDNHRADLKPGEACPLCGATEHPYATGDIPTPDELENEIQSLEKRLREARECSEAIIPLQDAVHAARTDQQNAMHRLQNANGLVETLVAQIQQRTTEIQATERNLESLRANLRQKVAPFGFEDVPHGSESEILDALSERRELWQENQSKRQKSDSDIAHIQKEISREQAIAAEIQSALEIKKREIQDKDRAIEEQSLKRAALLGDRDPDAVLSQSQSEIAAREKSADTANQQLQGANTEWTAANASLATLAERLQNSECKIKELEPVFQAARESLGFADEQAFVDARLANSQQQQWSATQLELAKRQHAIIQALDEKRSALQRESERELTDQSIEDLAAAKKQLELSNDVNQRRIGELQATLRKNQENQVRVTEKGSQIAQQQLECDRWEDLNHLIGSADGQKYRNFVQSITFQRLVHFANQQLAKMTDRYLLVPDKETSLNLSVIDRYQADEVRTTKNLSGGETFIASLALALGLSQLASHKVRVDSLFLDEGFGTLDEEAMDVALDTLSGLQQEGKLIGVISHVSALKERISTQIHVSPQGSGRSTLTGPGCSRGPAPDVCNPS